jgi:hypothetical protein
VKARDGTAVSHNGSEAGQMKGLPFWSLPISPIRVQFPEQDVHKLLKSDHPFGPARTRVNAIAAWEVYNGNDGGNNQATPP